MEPFFVKRRSFYFVFFSLLLLMVGWSLTSCQSLPEWVSTPMVGSDYFVGIGSSNVGNKTIDYEMGLKKARLELAKSISVEVQGHSDDRQLTLGDMEFQSRYEKIEETVSQHLELVEVANSFYSRKEGWWFLVRISKSEWQALVQKRESELKTQMAPLLSAASVGSPFEQLRNLGMATELLLDSAYSENLMVSTPSGEQLAKWYLNQGFLAAKRALNLRFKAQKSAFSLNETLKIDLKADATFSNGALPISVWEGNRRIFSSNVFFKGAVATFVLPKEGLLLGHHQLNGYFGEKQDSQLLLGQFSFELKPILLQRVVNRHLLGPFSQLQSLIERNLPIEVVAVPQQGTPALYYYYDIRLTPPNRQSPLYYAKGQLSLNLFDPITKETIFLFSVDASQVGGRSPEAVSLKLEERLMNDFSRRYSSDFLVQLLLKRTP